jgi:hypothetical protein
MRKVVKLERCLIVCGLIGLCFLSIDQARGQVGVGIGLNNVPNSTCVQIDCSKLQDFKNCPSCPLIQPQQIINGSCTYVNSAGSNLIWCTANGTGCAQPTPITSNNCTGQCANANTFACFSTSYIVCNNPVAAQGPPP